MWVGVVYLKPSGFVKTGLYGILTLFIVALSSQHYKGVE